MIATLRAGKISGRGNTEVLATLRVEGSGHEKSNTEVAVRENQERQRLLVKKHTLKTITIKINKLDAPTFMKCCYSAKSYTQK